ncbi:MAG: pantoate--beta-alanine ligase [Candidatus Omnitrophica bacterium]|nr:pantoate--beta-alanine ligase [Candidatus Omnitrophota bacterium]MDE2221991.1 pantoate--beta-alanine ligase [Candidatus Omnitrophota bacterium]
MRVVKTVKQLRLIIDGLRRKGRTIGFIPTMGYLHEGHLSLVRRCRQECDVTVVSIYVNPKQFGPHEDLQRYPRDIGRDSTMLKKENIDILFIPSDNAVYSSGYLTYIDVENVSRALCGAFRPGHFRGVATVVAKLLNMVQPHALYLGQKDAQQVAVLKRMAADLNFPVAVRTVPTMREADGLAMSSRNVYLSAAHRAQAPVIYKSLVAVRRCIRQGERRSATLVAMIKRNIESNSEGKIQYVACVDAESLEPLKTLRHRVLIAVAVFFGTTRLIDNVIVLIKN